MRAERESERERDEKRTAGDIGKKDKERMDV